MPFLRSGSIASRQIISNRTFEFFDYQIVQTLRVCVCVCVCVNQADDKSKD